MSGLLLLGLEPVSQAAGIIGADVAQALGIAEKTSRLYAMFREFAVSAYNTWLPCWGPALAQTAAQQALAWINDVAAGQQFAKLLARLYRNEKTLDDLSVVNLQSQAGLPKYLEAMRDLDGIGTTFQEQIGLVEKLLYGFRLVSTAAVAALPQATLLMAVAYMAILAYTVLAGADYADAQRVKIFNRVPGVRQIVETQLKGVVP